MAIEIVDLPMKNGNFPVRYVTLPEGSYLTAGKWWKTMKFGGPLCKEQTPKWKTHGVQNGWLSWSTYQIYQHINIDQHHPISQHPPTLHIASGPMSRMMATPARVHLAAGCLVRSWATKTKCGLAHPIRHHSPPFATMVASGCYGIYE